MENNAKQFLHKKYYDYIYDYILVIILLFTVISYEWINTDIMMHRSDKSNIPSLRCLLERNKNVNIEATMIKKYSSIYQITLTFDEVMKNSASFWSPYRIVDTFWSNMFKFNIVISTKTVDDTLSIIINPYGQRDNFFITGCNQKLPTQRISIKKNKR